MLLDIIKEMSYKKIGLASRKCTDKSDTFSRRNLEINGL